MVEVYFVVEASINTNTIKNFKIAIAEDEPSYRKP